MAIFWRTDWHWKEPQTEILLTNIITWCFSSTIVDKLGLQAMDVEFLYSFKFLCNGKYIKNQNKKWMEIGFHLGPLYNIKSVLQYVVEWHRSR